MGLTVKKLEKTIERMAYARKKKVGSWCKCKVHPTSDEADLSAFHGDGICSCGVFKHHVHCMKCGGITQIG